MPKSRLLEHDLLLSKEEVEEALSRLSVANPSKSDRAILESSRGFFMDSR